MRKIFVVCHKQSSSVLTRRWQLVPYKQLTFFKQERIIWLCKCVFFPRKLSRKSIVIIQLYYSVEISKSQMKVKHVDQVQAHVREPSLGKISSEILSYMALIWIGYKMLLIEEYHLGMAYKRIVCMGFRNYRLEFIETIFNICAETQLICVDKCCFDKSKTFYKKVSFFFENKYIIYK